jgi:uncharacterized membrane protein YdbT with pleckstrin-like domain
MDPEPGEEVFFHGHPSWRSMLAFHLKGFLSAIIVGVLVGVAGDLADRHVQVPWVVVAVVVWLAGVVLIGFVRRIQTTYTITDRRLTIDRGLLSRDVHETRLERVQNVNTSQSLLERLLRIGNVDFDTAGSAEFDFAFRGVDDPHRIARTVDGALQRIHGFDAPDATLPHGGV